MSIGKSSWTAEIPRLSESATVEPRYPRGVMKTNRPQQPSRCRHEDASRAALASLDRRLALAVDVETIGRIIDRADEIIADSDGEVRERAEAFAAKAEAKRQRTLLRSLAGLRS